jgi:iron complex transport system substrate-binding protein
MGPPRRGPRPPPDRLDAAHAPLLAPLLAAGAAQAAIDITDDQGQALRLAQPARRIVSLAPHITELLYAAGAGDKVVGAVQYSDYPEAAKMPAWAATPRSTWSRSRPQARPGGGLEERQPRRPPGQAARAGHPGVHQRAARIDDVAKSLAQFGRLAGTDAAGEAAAKAFRKRHAALVAKYSARPRCASSTKPGTAR